MAGTTVTTLAKKKMVKARAGISSLPKIVGMAFGAGGVVLIETLCNVKSFFGSEILIMPLY